MWWSKKSNISLCQWAACLSSSMAWYKEMCYCNLCLVSPPRPSSPLPHWLAMSLSVPAANKASAVPCSMLCFTSLNMLEKKKNLSVHLSVSQVISPLAGARVLGFGLRAVFAQSLSISQILKAQCIAVVQSWICMMVYSVCMIKIFMDTLYTNKYRCWNAG